MTYPNLFNQHTSSSSRSPILVIGSRGMLAMDLLARMELAQIPVIGLDLPEIDITRPEQSYSALKSADPALIINCAAYTAVDRAESEPEKAFAVNRDGAANLADACKELSIPLIHISTDYVFDGEATHPYLEDDPAHPLSVYGQSKWEGEEAIRARLQEHLIVRTAWLFGKHGQNFVKTILRLAREKEELRIVGDQHGCPTWTGDLAEALLGLCWRAVEHPESTPWGTYHFCNSERTTWHGFACAIIEEARRRAHMKVATVSAISTTEYPTPARRPMWSVLDCTKIQETFGVKPRSWRLALCEMMKDLYSRS